MLSPAGTAGRLQQCIRVLCAAALTSSVPACLQDSDGSVITTFPQHPLTVFCACLHTKIAVLPSYGTLVDC